MGRPSLLVETEIISAIQVLLSGNEVNTFLNGQEATNRLRTGVEHRMETEVEIKKKVKNTEKV